MSDYKTRARRLRTALAATGVEISHSASLELLAAEEGAADWNTLVAQPEPAPEPLVIPILRIFPGGGAERFYRDFLGFTIDWVHSFEGDKPPFYLQVSREGSVLHLSEHHGDGTPGTVVRIWVADVVTLQRTLRDSDVSPLRIGLHREPWGDDLSIPDPFGNTLVFTSPRPD